ncbi:hypothetical protein MKQ70_14785 [Chitinophaga sedimenti]|uniref:hypothetical protein n=1 Tax=Chitinophaga sedimenti TaxID=2033606 RepID=UPI0020045E33|nr:hypothetical protein [Chitinophaga sedimenti]MCK7556211.1 hypothetical protein [Chitinophaga sedimenti]
MNGITGIDWLTTGREGPAQPMQAARSLRAALPAILLLIPFGIAYFYVPYSFMISYGLRTWLVCIASTIVVAWLALLRQILQREGAVVITYTDLLLPVFVASAFLLSGAHPFSQETPVSYVAAAMLYFCVRGMATPRSVYVLFLLLGALLLYSIGTAGWQAAGLSFSKGHLSMAFKATFGNVGLFAGYIAAMYAIFIFLALKYSPVNWQRPCCIMITAFFAMVMVFSQSRAALLSFLVSALLLSDIYLPHARRAISFIRKSHIAKLCIGLLVSLFLVFLFQIKSGSSYGRALIWKIAAKKIFRAPTYRHRGRAFHA